MSDTWVDLITAKDATEARVIQAVLHAAGIPAVTEGDHLADEWAASQRLMGQIGSTVRVPRSQLETARAVLAEARQAARDEPDVDEDGDGSPRSIGSTSPYDAALRARSWPGGAVVTTSLLAIACMILGGLWLSARAEIEQLTDHPHFAYEWNENGTELTQRLKRTQALLSIFEDHDGDGFWEVARNYAPDGTLASRGEYRDGDGRWERGLQYSPADGRIVLETRDADGDGFPEKVIIETAEGRRRVFEDRDGDGRYDVP